MRQRVRMVPVDKAKNEAMGQWAVNLLSGNPGRFLNIKQKAERSSSYKLTILFCVIKITCKTPFYA